MPEASSPTRYRLDANGSSVPSGRVETTYVFAWPALVTNDFCAVIFPPAIWLTGAQKWLRDPRSLNASVPRSLPRRQAAQGLGVPGRRAGERHLGGADVHQVDHGRRCAPRRQRAGRLEELGGTAAGAAGRRRNRQAEQARIGERVDRLLREAGVAVDGRCASRRPRRGRGRDRPEVRGTSVGLLLELHHGCTRPGARSTRSSSAHHGAHLLPSRLVDRSAHDTASADLHT